MTAPGWTRGHASEGARERIRERLGILRQALVVGLAGSLHWNDRVGYAYGAELVRAVRMVSRPDVVAVIVGDGSGRTRLEEMAGDDLGRRVLLPGRVPAEEVPDYLASFDVGQPLAERGRRGVVPLHDETVGVPRERTPCDHRRECRRLTTSTRATCGACPGRAPWSAGVHPRARRPPRLAEPPRTWPTDEHAIARRRGEPFDKAAQQRRMSEFVRDILAERARAR